MGVPQPDIKVKLTPGNRKPKGRRSRPKAELRRTGKKEIYAYTFKDPNLGEFKVLNSMNAWWLESVKLQQLVDAYKFYATDDEACYYAGISMTQLQYFQELHPDFYTIKHAAKQDITLRAKKALMKGVENDKGTASWLLERLQKDIFSTRQETTGANGRDLFDQQTQALKELGEKISKANDSETKKHISDSDADNTDAGQDRHTDEAGTTDAKLAGEGVPETTG